MNERFEYLYELGKKYPVKVPVRSIREAVVNSHDMLINVQPLTPPAGLINYIRFRYSKHKELPTANQVTIQEED
jgi:hypothetical protein